MENGLEKYDKLVTAVLVMLAFGLAIGYMFAEEKSEPMYSSKIDKLMFDKTNKAPKFILTLPDDYTTLKQKIKEDLVIDAKELNKEKQQKQVQKNTHTFEEIIANVPNIYNLKEKRPDIVHENIDFNKELIELSENSNKLPKISKEGKYPWTEYGNSVKVEPNFKKVAIVISDLGQDINQLQQISKVFNSAVSFSFSPYSRNLHDAIIKSRERGHETYTDLLLFSKDFLKEDSGPLSIDLSKKEGEVRASFHKIIATPAPIGGIIIKDGLVDIDNAKKLNTILTEVKSRGLLAVNATKNEFVAKQKVEGIAHGTADIIIDKDMNKQTVTHLLSMAENIAFNQGQVLVVADSKPFILQLLYKWIDTFSPQVTYEEAKNIEITKPFALVPLSNLVVE